MDPPNPEISKNVSEQWPVLAACCRLYWRRRTKFHHESPPESRRNNLRYLTTVAVMANLAVASVYAQSPVTMAFSGTSTPSTVDLKQPNTQNDEDNFTGAGTLGRFTFRNIRAIENSPSPSNTCSGTNQVFFNDPAGAGVFRFEDGSLL